MRLLGILSKFGKSLKWNNLKNSRIKNPSVNKGKIHGLLCFKIFSVYSGPLSIIIYNKFYPIPCLAYYVIRIDEFSSRINKS